MPRIKRWFPVSHDINADAEVWAMRHEIGEKSLSVWLEILSIADRNESELPGDYEELIRSVSGRCQATVRTVRAVFEWAKSRLWLTSEPTLRVAKYGKYHISRDTKGIPRGNLTVSLPSEPSEPSLIKIKRREDNTSPLTVGETSYLWPSVEALVALYNSEASDHLPAVTRQSKARIAKAKAYLSQFPDLHFWQEVFRETKLSRFLQGLNSKNGHEGFKGDFDWLLTKGKDGTENAVKVFEGRYRDATR